MDTEIDKSGSHSAPSKPESSSSDIAAPTLAGSNANLNSSESQGPPDSETNTTNKSSLGEVNLPLVKNKTDEATAQADTHNTVEDNDKPIRSDDGKLKDKTAYSSCESDENNEDEEDSSDSASLESEHVRAVKGQYGPDTTKDQGSILVRGLMDYLRVLEERMGKLESNAGLHSDPVKDRKSNSPSPVEDDDAVIMDARFFNSVDHLKDDGHLGVHDETQRNTNMCNQAKHLIHVLYSWVNEDMGLSSDRSVAEPPHANDIDIITFCVQSEPIAEFFEWELRITLDSSHTIRFRKPFKAVIKNISRIKEQLLKLENNFGRMTESVKQSQLNTAEIKADRKESDPLSFDKPAALPHFQSFVAFVDKYLGKQINLYNRLREAKEERVAFENLWMLFESMDTIYCPLREVGQDEKINLFDDTGNRPKHKPIRRHTPQAYRVVTASWGTPRQSFFASSKTRKFINTSIAPRKVDLPVLSEEIAPAVPISTRIGSSYYELYISCFYLDFNGLRYGAVSDVFIFKPYEGEIDIRSLQVYPIEYAGNHMLSDRGKKFLQLTKVSHKHYEGSVTGSNREEINSPVIVDVKLAFEGDWDIKNQSIEVPEFNSRSDYALGRQLEDYYDVQGKPSCSNPWCYGESCVGDVYRESYERGRYNIMSEMRLVLEEYETLKQRGSTGRKQFRHLMEDKDMVRLLPGTVPGFALRSRRWVLLDINLLREVEQNSEWDNLFLPPGHQDMVQALVETHTSGREGTKGMDLVRGKGKGCIILLHGVPGVGKTSTAECVATHTKKPLYPITCGDIGYYAEDVERNMETHFKLAHRWGCVLLLDEADVFLAKRDQKDIERNGLVSVFLRILEYYSGILFLTTNRVGAIDDAFRSRLHLILYYPKLAKGQTNNIFTYNFKRIAAINIEREKNNLLPFEYTNTEDEILKWAKKNYKNLGWNGRQIRNAFQTVLALSEFKAKGKKNKSKNSDKQANPVVKLRYFKVVANAMNQFNEYLKATHGYDEDRVAKRDFIRAAEFSPKSHPLLTETEDSSDQDSDEGDSNESDPDRSKSKYDRDQSDDSDSDLDHGKTKKKKSKARAKKESGSKSVTKKTKKVKDDSAKSEKQSKDKRKDKGEKEDTEDSE